MSDLIERLKGLQEWYSRNTGEGILHAVHLNALSKAITALSPALPDDVAELAAWLDEYTADDPMHSAVNSHYKLRRILKMLERQAQEIATLQAQVAALEARNEELEEWVILRCNELGAQIEFRDKRIEKLQAQVKELEGLTAITGVIEREKKYIAAQDRIEELEAQVKELEAALRHITGE